MHRHVVAFMRVLLLAGFAFAFSPAGAQPPTKRPLTVKVSGIHNTDGNIRLALRSDPRTTVQGRIAAIDTKSMTATAVFEGVAPGTYDVAVIHDENKNGQLDFNDMGMPVEGYGHSNNPPKEMGPPSFNQSKFSLSGSTKSLEIELIYWP